jgi:hypothetical protein
MTVSGLAALCDRHIVEISFVRRTKGIIPPTRRILCTRDRSFLNSALSKQIFNFIPPSKPHPYDAASKGLVTVFDILMQDWRNIPASSCEVIMAISTQPNQNFWQFFDKKIRSMSSLQKESFMLNRNNQRMTMVGQTETGKRFYNVRNEKGKFFKIRK